MGRNTDYPLDNLTTFNYGTAVTLNAFLTLAFFNKSDELTLDTLEKALAVADKARLKIRQRDGVARGKSITKMITIVRNRLEVLKAMQISLNLDTIATAYPAVQEVSVFLEANRAPKVVFDATDTPLVKVLKTLNSTLINSGRQSLPVVEVLKTLQDSFDINLMAITYHKVQEFIDFVTHNTTTNVTIDASGNQVVEVKTVINPKYGVTLHKDGKIIVLIKDFAKRSKLLHSKALAQLAEAQSLVAFNELSEEALIEVFSEYRIEDGQEVKYIYSADGLTLTKIS